MGTEKPRSNARSQPSPASPVRLFLCGDVMTGRGVDQVLPHPGDPRIHESYLKSARAYVRLAEQANGPFPHPVDFSYIWGDALEELARAAPTPFPASNPSSHALAATACRAALESRPVADRTSIGSPTAE